MAMAVTLKEGVDSFSQIAIECGSKVAATSAKVVNTTAKMCSTVDGGYPFITFFKNFPLFVDLVRGYSTLSSRKVAKTFADVDSFLNASRLQESVHAVASGAVKSDWNSGKKERAFATVMFGGVNFCSTIGWLDDMKLVNLGKIAEKVGKGCLSFVKKIALDTTLFAFLVAGLVAALVDTVKNCANQEDRTAVKLKVVQLVSDTVRYSINLFRLPLQPVCVTLGTLSGALGIVAGFRKEYK
jgi:hypothetical protein